MQAYVEVVYPDGTNEVFPIEGDQATLGRSPSATVALPDVRELEPEHLLIAPRSDGVWLSPVQGAATPVMQEGKPLPPGKVAWGSWIEIGTIKVRITPTRPHAEEHGSESEVSPLMKVVLLLALVAAGAMFLFRNTRPELPRRTKHAPPDLVGEITGRCEASGEVARTQGEQAAEAATLHDERYPFDPQDGIQAIRLYAKAAACFDTAGLAEAAVEARSKAAALKKKIEEDFLHARFRLSRALTEKRYRDALREAKRISAFVRHVPGDYQKWVETLERRLALRVQKSP